MKVLHRWARKLSSANGSNDAAALRAAVADVQAASRAVIKAANDLAESLATTEQGAPRG